MLVYIGHVTHIYIYIYNPYPSLQTVIINQYNNPLFLTAVTVSTTTTM
jgi:hypothetical protein